MGTFRGEVPSASAAAIRIGPGAWEWLTAADRSGRVGGCFRGGVNAVFGSEALVCLQSPSIPIHPWALVADFPWDEIEEGAPVTVTRGELSVGRFALPLAEAEVVDLSFHPPERRVSPQELQERLGLIEQLLAETPDPFESAFDRAFVCDRDCILAEWQETGDPGVLLALIGRGPGTTPAGDDTLIGLLAGLEVLAAVSPLATGSSLQATCHSPPARAHLLLQATRHMLLARSHLPTSLLSAQTLSTAAAGLFSQPLLDLQRVLVERETTTTEVSRAGTTTLLTGHTTGRSALLGLVARLAVVGFEWIGSGLSVMHGWKT